MKLIRFGKIAFDRKLKRFNGDNEYSVESFEDISERILFPITRTDESIIKEYDKKYRENIDIWTIEITFRVV